MPVIRIMKIIFAYAESVSILAKARAVATSQCPVNVRIVRARIFIKNPPNGGRPLRLRRIVMRDCLMVRLCFIRLTETEFIGLKWRMVGARVRA